MLIDERLQQIQADREREIETARRVHEARAAMPRRDGGRSWFGGRPEGPVARPTRPQTGSAATDPSL
jgi:hypothetical protein